MLLFVVAKLFINILNQFKLFAKLLCEGNNNFFNLQHHLLTNIRHFSSLQLDFEHTYFNDLFKIQK